MSYQVLSGIKTFSASDTWTELFYVGHSHSVQIQYMVVEDSNMGLGGAHGELSFFTTYGNSSGPQNHYIQRNAMNGGGVSSDPHWNYQNSGGSVSYLIRSKISYSGSGPFTIRYVVRGLSSGGIYAL